MIKTIKHRWTPSACKCKFEFFRQYTNTSGEWLWDLSVPDKMEKIEKCSIHSVITDSEVYDHALNSEEKLKNLIGLHLEEVHGRETAAEFFDSGYEFTGTGKDRVIRVKPDKLTKQLNATAKKAIKDFVRDNKAIHGVKYDKEIEI